MAPTGNRSREMPDFIIALLDANDARGRRIGITLVRAAYFAVQRADPSSGSNIRLDVFASDSPDWI